VEDYVRPPVLAREPAGPGLRIMMSVVAALLLAAVVAVVAWLIVAGHHGGEGNPSITLPRAAVVRVTG
jgi:hypothetical protein